jgi:hypothetical protein
MPTSLFTGSATVDIEPSMGAIAGFGCDGDFVARAERPCSAVDDSAPSGKTRR